MAHFVNTEINDGTNVVCSFQGIGPKELAGLVDGQLLSSGYAFLQGEPMDALYEKGNRVKRIFLGVFHRYFKMGVRIDDSDPALLRVRIHKFSPDVAGGLIGLRQVKRELNILAVELAKL
jgi:hypothetical protein